MSVGLSRVLLASACVLWLAGCASGNFGDLTLTNPLGPSVDAANEAASAPVTTGTIPEPPPQYPSPGPTGTPGLLGGDPNDNLTLGKRHFRAGNFGNAEKHFRKAVEMHPSDAEAWLGLAAAYDRLKRFDLADRAYDQALTISGPRVEILNNQGFSMILRGDYKRAREKLHAARSADPQNRNVLANLELLEESTRKGKAPQ